MSIVVEHIVSFIVFCLRHLCHGSSTLKATLSSGVFFLSITLTSNAQVNQQDVNVSSFDTLKRTTLEEVSVSAQRTPSEIRTAAPTQVIDAEKLEHIGALQLSDALKQMAGVTVKDYGGVGGIKTVSARGLGSQFSAVTIDGIPVDDSQNGQVDLSRYLLGNTSFVSFSQGQEQSSLLSARAYAAGNVLNMETSEPQFWPGEHTKIKVGSEIGSYDPASISKLNDTLTWNRIWQDLVSTQNHSILWEQRWSKKLKSSFFVNYLRSDGDYPFTLYYTSSHSDSLSSERRKHSAVWMMNADGNLFYTIGKGNTLNVKIHYLRGEHQLPGPVHFYSQDKSNENTREEAAFIQTRWRVERERWKMQLTGKLQSNYDFYEDSTSSSLSGYLFNEYRQQLAYMSGSIERQLGKQLFLDLAVDGDAGRLQSNLTQRNDVTRTHLTAAAALRYQWRQVELRAHMLFTDIHDRVNDLDTMPGYQRATPYFSMLWKTTERTHVRLFYKDSYRPPSFGELYFFQSIPRNLKPEHARQVNLGLTHRQQWEQASMGGTLDVYYNAVENKIVARPGHNMYYWTMENLGQVDILGIDATLNFQINLCRQDADDPVSDIDIRLNYSYQRALDHSVEGGKTYGHQIVYTPRHSGGGSLRWENRWVNLGVTAMVVGERYSGPQNTADNRLPAYCDLGLSADRSFDLRIGTLTLRASVMNLLDTQYEVVRSYPMMGRNWKIGISYEF